jgi:SAM-dependent methyltransferase
MVGETRMFPTTTSAALPSPSLAAAQAEWLRGARSRLLRRADIAHRRRVLDLGAGWGHVSHELQQRSGGSVVALDCATLPSPVECGIAEQHPGIERVVANAEALPFADDSFDLVFAQFTFLWIGNPRQAIAEARRVLAPGGVLAAIEPDFGGLMEHPGEIALRDVWLAALGRSGADPCVGRKLADWFVCEGLRVESLFPDRLEPADPRRFDLLGELPLTPDERARLETVRACWPAHAPRAAVHLPCWLVLGRKQLGRSSDCDSS